MLNCPNVQLNKVQLAYCSSMISSKWSCLVWIKFNSFNVQSASVQYDKSLNDLCLLDLLPGGIMWLVGGISSRSRGQGWHINIITWKGRYPCHPTVSCRGRDWMEDPEWQIGTRGCDNIQYAALGRHNFPYTALGRHIDYYHTPWGCDNSQYAALSHKICRPPFTKQYRPAHVIMSIMA